MKNKFKNEKRYADENFTYDSKYGFSVQIPKEVKDMTDGKAIHSSIQYIESNPVRSGLAEKPEDWKWSSTYARVNEKCLITDKFNIPVSIS